MASWLDLHFWQAYLWTLLCNWFSLALALLGINELSEWLSQRSFRWLHHHRGKVALGLIFCAQVSTYHDLSKRQAASSSATLPNPIKLDVTDVDGRRELAKMKTDLQNANETIEKQQAVINPLSQRISSARFAIILNLRDKETPGHEIDDGLLIILGSNGKGLLYGTTTEHSSNGQGERRYVVDVPVDAGNIGEPIESLANATDIFLQFKESLMPLGTVILGGEIFLVLNNQITVKFDIPGQTLARKANNNPDIALRDIQKQIRQVIQPSLRSATPTVAPQPSPIS